ncbi:MAG: hypothetical protein WDA47_05965 [Bacilli bacterium]|jgi:hypothetical protein
MNGRKVGALWIQEGQKGKYYSGELIVNGKKVRIVAFNRDKRNPKEPDIDILLAREREGIVTDDL